MKAQTKILLQHIWLWPFTMVYWALYLTPLLILKIIKWEEDKEDVHIFRVNDKLSKWKMHALVHKFYIWYINYWKDWGATAGPYCIILSPTSKLTEKLFKHEKSHVDDTFKYGCIFPLVYAGHSVWLWLFHKDKHSYLDNFSERKARQAAGQKVDFTKEEWPHGEDDRWAWW